MGLNNQKGGVMNVNRRLHEAFGHCWHESFVVVQPYIEYEQDRIVKCVHCEKQGSQSDLSNPDYAADPRLVLREMMKREDWIDFFQWASDHKKMLDYNGRGSVFIKLKYLLDTTGKLRDIAIEWLEKGG